MSNFKIGEKVVCIDNNFFCLYNDVLYPKKEKTYTIRKIIERRTGGIGFQFDELINPIKNYIGGYVECNFNANNFRKLDYEFAENLLKEISESVNQKHLQN